MKQKSSLRNALLAIALLLQLASPAAFMGGTAAAADAASGDGAAAAAKTPELPGIAQITGGLGFTVALKTDGTVWSWGDNQRGKLGYGNNQIFSRYTPAQVKGMGDIAALAAGMNHTLAVGKDGRVWAWGYNNAGQLGTGDKIDKNEPTLIDGLYRIKSVAAGTDFSVALDEFGYVYTWGNNLKGQLGLGGSETEQLKPTKVPGLDGIQGIAAGAAHVVAISSLKSTVVWGDNSFGQLGTGGFGNVERKPIVTNRATAVKAVAAGSSFSMALDENGEIWAWGNNLKGQLGDGTTKDDFQDKAIRPMNGGGDIVNIAAGSTHGIALRKDGTVITWGAGSQGQLGLGTQDNYVPLATSIQDGFNNVALIGSGAFHTMAVKADGSVYTWGNNVSGQLGDGTTTNRNKPVLLQKFNLIASNPAMMNPDELVKPASPVTGATSRIAAGDSFTVLLKNGKLWSWGDSMFGQLGNGKNRMQNVPGAIDGLSGASAVAAGSNHAGAVQADGTVRSWGINAFGQLGDGTTTNRNTPAAAADLTGTVQIAAGNGFSLALKSDGSVWASGDNTYGQLGDGTSAGRTNYAKVPDLPRIVQVEAGYNHALALADDGTVLAWGDNVNGQLGDGSTLGHRVPTPINGLGDVVSIKAGKAHSLALKKDGTVWAWGFNVSGQLGDDSTTSRTKPVQVVGLNQVKAIAAGGSHSVALRADGTVWAWGLNFFGQLGNGSAANAAKPVQTVGIAGGVEEIAAGSNHTAAIGTDGTVWTWGSNSSGQLGDGTYDNRSVPVHITGFAPAFSDLGKHWAAGSITKALEKGYVDGYEDQTFRPDNRVTRAEFAKLIATALRVKTDSASSGQAWYMPYVEALFAANVYGHEDVHVEWDGPITRLEIARIADRASMKELQKPDTALDERWAMRTATQKGLLQGLEGGALAPDQPTTRAQSVAIVERILTIIGGGTLPVDEEAVRNAEAAMNGM